MFFGLPTSQRHIQTPQSQRQNTEWVAKPQKVWVCGLKLLHYKSENKQQLA